ncbi:hypothetical protein V6Z11_D04G127600 [Gossypium hirsutum]
MREKATIKKKWKWLYEDFQACISKDSSVG